MLAPCGDRVGLVQAHRGCDRLPEPLDVGLAEDDLRPALVRERNDRPVAEPVGQPQARLGDLPHARPSDSAPVEVGEELGFGVAGDCEERAALGPEVVQSLHEPGRRVAQCVLGGVLDVRAADVLVGVEHVHEARPRRIRLARDCPDEGLVFDECVDPEQLAGLQVETDLNREPGVLAQSDLGRGHSGGQSTALVRAGLLEGLPVPDSG